MTDTAGSDTTPTRSIRVWDLPVRLFHWSLVFVILVAFLSSEEGPLAPWHVPAGWVAAVLIAFRLLWGIIGGEHARFADFLKPAEVAHHLGGMIGGKTARSVGHNALGGLAIVALLGAVGVVVYTGATMQGESGEGLHEALAYLLLGLIVLHVMAVVVMSFLTRENLIVAFITGRKRADLHPGAIDARPPATLAVPLAVIAIGGAAYGATRIDPVAFTPGGHAGGEGGGEARDRDSD